MHLVAGREDDACQDSRNYRNHFGSGLATINDLNDDGVVDLVVGSRMDDAEGEWFSNMGAIYILYLSPICNEG